MENNSIAENMTSGRYDDNITSSGRYDDNITSLGRYDDNVTSPGLRLPSFPWQAALPIYSIQIMVALGILVGNSLVFFLYYKFDISRTFQHKFLLQLSSSDLLAVPAIILAIGLDQPEFLEACINYKAARLLCYFAADLMGVYAASSVLSVLSLTVDRFLQVVWSLRYPSLITEKIFKIIIGIIWTYATFISALSVIFNTWAPYKICRPPQIFSPLIYLYFGVPMLLVPIIIILFLYIWMLIVAAKKSRETYIVALPSAIQGQNMENNPMTQLHRTNLKGVKRLGIVIGLLIVSFLIPALNPYILPWHGETDPYRQMIMRALSEISIIGLYMNSFFNPIIYHSRLPAFKRAWRRFRNQQVEPMNFGTNSQ